MEKDLYVRIILAIITGCLLWLIMKPLFVPIRRKIVDVRIVDVHIGGPFFAKRALPVEVQ